MIIQPFFDVIGYIPSLLLSLCISEGGISIPSLSPSQECIDNDGDVTSYALNTYIDNKSRSLPSEIRPKQTPFLNCSRKNCICSLSKGSCSHKMEGIKK